MTQEFTRTSGAFKVISFIVIMLNREFICMCRKKNHSQFRWSILTLTGQLIQIRMLQKKTNCDYWNVEGNRNLSDSWSHCREGTEFHCVYNLVARQLPPWEEPNVTLRKWRVHKSSNNALRLPRETVVMLQKWDSNPIRSESPIYPACFADNRACHSFFPPTFRENRPRHNQIVCKVTIII